MIVKIILEENAAALSRTQTFLSQAVTHFSDRYTAGSGYEISGCLIVGAMDSAFMTWPGY